MHIHQINDTPRLMVTTDRVMAQQSGLAEQEDMASSLSVSLASSGTTSTNFWLNYKNGVSYQVVTQTPQHRVSSLAELNRTPISTGNGTPQLLGNLRCAHPKTTDVSPMCSTGMVWSTI